MANQNQNGRNVTMSDEQRQSWRPQDQSMRDDRDDERSMSDRDRGRRDLHDEGYRMAERYGQGQSGYASGRYGEDRSLGYESRNQGYGGRYEDRQQMGMDERFSGRGSQGYSQGRDIGRQDIGRQDMGRSDEGLGQRGFGGGDRWFNQGFTPGGFNQQTSFNPVGGPMGGYGGYGDPRGNEGREGYGTQGPGPGRSAGYGQGGSFGGSVASRSGQWGQGQQSGFGGSQHFNVQGGGGYGGYGQHLGGGSQGGYGMQGSAQSGFGMHQDVRGPHRGKGPQGWQRSDDRIRDMICEVLTDDDQIDATNIEITVTGGEVRLSGTVPDRQMKRMAEDIVERVSGVKDVQNQLKVGPQERGTQMPGRGTGKNEPEPSKHRA